MDSLGPPGLDEDLLDLTIRFSASIPDLLLTIPQSAKATTSTLKQRIRKHLPEEFSRRRLRLIYAGKALADNGPLLSIVKRSYSGTPSRSSTPLPQDSDNLSDKVKGKTVIRDPPAASRIYIHCSISDVELSPSDLAAESILARGVQSTTAQPGPTNDDNVATNTTTAPAPRGFDRLLNAGFSHAELLSLRSQFMAIQAHTHTPDTMPSPHTLRDMEDEWLDNGDTAELGANALDEEGQAGALDDLIWGSAMGFFWPVGCLWWACREEGIWSRRRKMAVVVGVLVNAGFGCLRWMR